MNEKPPFPPPVQLDPTLMYAGVCLPTGETPKIYLTVRESKLQNHMCVWVYFCKKQNNPPVCMCVWNCIAQRGAWGSLLTMAIGGLGGLGCGAGGWGDE